MEDSFRSFVEECDLLQVPSPYTVYIDIDRSGHYYRASNYLTTPAHLARLSTHSLFYSETSIPSCPHSLFLSYPKPCPVVFILMM